MTLNLEKKRSILLNSAQPGAELEEVDDMQSAEDPDDTFSEISTTTNNSVATTTISAREAAAYIANAAGSAPARRRIYPVKENPLEGYFELERDEWENIPIRSRIRYVGRDGKLKSGGWIIGRLKSANSAEYDMFELGRNMMNNTEKDRIKIKFDKMIKVYKLIYPFAKLEFKLYTRLLKARDEKIRELEERITILENKKK